MIRWQVLSAIFFLHYCLKRIVANYLNASINLEIIMFYAMMQIINSILSCKDIKVVFMVSIEEMEVILDNIAAELPQEIFKGLNGGILLLPQAKPHAEKRANNLYILGEYHRDINLGKFIAIYYGSFSLVYGHLPVEQLKMEIRKTLKHEFVHHLEGLAGERELEIEDARLISEYLKTYGEKV
jgi:hypothetical protein